MMLRGALAFFILGLVAILLGANGVAGLSIEIGKTLLFVFLGLAVISAVIGLVSGRGSKSIVGALAALALLGAPVLGNHSALADENVGEKVENTANDAKRGAKKGVRKAKRGVRNATGNESKTEDAKDAVKNTGDSIGDGASKIKNKVD